MPTLILVAGSSCILCLLLVPCARVLALRVGLVDQPDGRRKIHARAIPVTGGLAIFASIALTLAAVAGYDAELLALDGRGRVLLGLLLAAVVIVAVGVADDYGSLRGRHKLFGQLLAVLLVVLFGPVVRTVALLNYRIDLGPLAVPFTIVWLLGVINALNLIDGMDGLLGCVGLIISSALAVMAAVAGRGEVALVAGALAGALAGFLRFNFPPACIFLGDAGSMLVGLVLGTLVIEDAIVEADAISLAVPATLLTIPFFDTTAAIVRRKLTGRSIYTTDRGHLHHCLLRRGYSNRRVLLVVSFFCALAVLGAMTSKALQQELIALATAAVVVATLVGSRLFGHPEYLLVQRWATGLARSFLRWRVRESQQTEVRLQGTIDWKEVWGELIAQAEWLNLKMIRLNVNAPSLHEGYHAVWHCPHVETEENRLWRAEMPLTVNGLTLGRLEVIGQNSDETVWKELARVLPRIEDFESGAAALFQPVPHIVACEPAEKQTAPSPPLTTAV